LALVDDERTGRIDGRVVEGILKRRGELQVVRRREGEKKGKEGKGERDAKGLVEEERRMR